MLALRAGAIWQGRWLRRTPMHAGASQPTAPMARRRIIVSRGFGPRPIALSTISVVTSELLGTPAPAADATIVVSMMVASVSTLRSTPYRWRVVSSVTAKSRSLGRASDAISQATLAQESLGTSPPSVSRRVPFRVPSRRQNRQKPANGRERWKKPGGAKSLRLRALG